MCERLVSCFVLVTPISTQTPDCRRTKTTNAAVGFDAGCWPATADRIDRVAQAALVESRWVWALRDQTRNYVRAMERHRTGVLLPMPRPLPQPKIMAFVAI